MLSHLARSLLSRLMVFSVQIDPQLLFQRLVIAAKANDNLEYVFKYELCSYPPALFDSAQLLRESHKPVLSGLFCHQTGLILLVKFSMFWTVLHSFTAFHGQEGPLTKRYALRTQGMS